MGNLKVLCFAAELWSDIAKRNQCLMRELSKDEAVASLLYVNPPVFSSINDVVKGRFMPSHLAQGRNLHWKALCGRLTNQVTEKIWTYTGSQKALPRTRFATVRRWEFLKRINLSLYGAFIRRYLNRLPGQQLVVWLSHPFHAFAITAFPERALLVYDWMDDWEQFEILPVKNPKTLADLNQRILERADIVLTVSEKLWQRAKAVSRNTFLVPNATDYELFRRAADGKPVIPSTMASIPSPRIGYFGSIGDRIDFSLLRQIAEAHPDWSIVMVGSVWPNKRDQAEALGSLPNVYFLGAQPYQTLPAFLRGFDVCIIPHTRDALTASMDPIKLYDYLASGKPIVCTPVAGVERFAEVLYIAETPTRFAGYLETAFQENGSLTAKRLQYARENTWQRRSMQVLQIIEARLGK
jgi:glycosyltransferase involved in cell wall biosynthesis